MVVRPSSQRWVYRPDYLTQKRSQKAIAVSRGELLITHPCAGRGLVVCFWGCLTRSGYANRPVYLGPAGRLQGDRDCPAGAVGEMAFRTPAGIYGKVGPPYAGARPAGEAQEALPTAFALHWRDPVILLQHGAWLTLESTDLVCLGMLLTLGTGFGVLIALGIWLSFSQTPLPPENPVSRTSNDEDEFAAAAEVVPRAIAPLAA